jgi:hypothetical protein
MQSQWKAALAGGSAMLAASADALAQNPPQPFVNQPPPAAGRAPLYDPQQLPAQRGRVQQFTLTPRGDIDGLILTDGTEVKTPPHLSTQIAYAIKPGDSVTIHGLHAAALSLVQAVSITNDATGHTVVDDGPPGPGRGPVPPPPLAMGAGPSGPLPGLMEVQGRVRTLLHGPEGDVNGALLDDGAVLRLPPPEAYRFASLLQPGQMIVAAGTAMVTAMGTVLEAQQIGASREQLSLVDAPPSAGFGPPGPPPPAGFGPPGPPPPPPGFRPFGPPRR